MTFLLSAYPPLQPHPEILSHQTSSQHIVRIINNPFRLRETAGKSIWNDTEKISMAPALRMTRSIKETQPFFGKISAGGSSGLGTVGRWNTSFTYFLWLDLLGEGLEDPRERCYWGIWCSLLWNIPYADTVQRELASKMFGISCSRIV
jgi:hypothetical protein